MVCFSVRIKEPHKDQYIQAYGINPKTTQYIYLHLCIYMFRIFALNFLAKILVVLLICEHLCYLTRSIFDLVTDLMPGKGRIMQATRGGQAKRESEQQCQPLTSQRILHLDSGEYQKHLEIQRGRWGRIPMKSKYVPASSFCLLVMYQGWKD